MSTSTWTATHTPGPWEINEGDGMAIAKVSMFAITAPCTANIGSGLSREENAANARLIAAAPDLLAICQQLEREGDARVQIAPDLRVALRAAIVAATGDDATRKNFDAPETGD